MPRLRLRLSNLVMLLIIIALVMALVVQWRRESTLRLENDRLRTDLASSPNELKWDLYVTGHSITHVKSPAVHASALRTGDKRETPK
jgi:hypothetical protein